MTKIIDQDWLDEHMYSVPADVEPELDRLAIEADRIANCEHDLIQAIREHQAQLARLPEIIRLLEARRGKAGLELADALEQHDQLAAAHKFLAEKQQPAEAEA